MNDLLLVLGVVGKMVAVALPGFLLLMGVCLFPINTTNGRKALGGLLVKALIKSL